ncbi:hypothetical protein K4B79_18835 [Streptomyces lincolnensis]|uniref:hypothetical protein n=1 Tax=Streptomyces lincolnensis TaxID=1915 RepID=UPI001E477BB1|nr:hypothetical protein [Streptomyces lincolnensis]MCD7440272.1 hypothetical protein [Streptomyces lincolnensis]
MSMDDRPEALDALLAHVADNLPDETASALVRLTAAVDAEEARERDGIRDTSPLSRLRLCPRPEHHDPHDYDEDDETGLHCLGLADGESTADIASPTKQLATLEEQSAARIAALLAPLERKVREHRAQERAEIRAAVLAIAARHLRTTLFHQVYDDAGLRTAEGVTRAADELLRLVADPNVATTAPVADADRVAAALAEVRRLCEMTIAASVRVGAIDQARDTLAAIDRVMAAEAQQGGAQQS